MVEPSNPIARDGECNLCQPRLLALPWAVVEDVMTTENGPPPSHHHYVTRLALSHIRRSLSQTRREALRGSSRRGLSQTLSCHGGTP